MPPLSDAERAALRRHLQYGGFLLVDAADGSDGGGFDASVRAELARVLPASPLRPIPQQHVLYKSFYLVDHQGGRVLTKAWLEGQLLDGRLAVVYSQNDLAGAWARSELGEWDYPCTPGGEAQREQAFRLGVNMAMYALCTDYKDDAVHLPRGAQGQRERPADEAATDDGDACVHRRPTTRGARSSRGLA